MKVGLSYVTLLISLLLTVCRADLLQYANKIPQCGLSCLLQTIPSSVCQTLSNSTCICGNDDLLAATVACMSTNCTILERLEFEKIDEIACNKPQQRRDKDIPGLLVAIAVALLCFATRLYTRYTVATKTEADDWLVTGTLLAYLVFTGLGLFVRIKAIGYNIWDVDADTLELALRIFFIEELFYTLVLALARAGILLFLIRIFDAPKFRVISWVVLGWVVTSATVIIFLTIFQCTPISYSWEIWVGEMTSARCIDVNAFSYAAAASGIAQDLVILILPIPIIARLQMTPKRRFMTLFMFSFGVFALATSCIRLQYLGLFGKSPNPTWDYTDLVIWTGLEVNVAVIVLCLPTFRILLARLFPSIFVTNITNTAPKTLTPHSGPRRLLYEDLSDESSLGHYHHQLLEDEIELRQTFPIRPTVIGRVGALKLENRTQDSAEPQATRKII